MVWWIAILLGCVQGFTEFLPISSSGHLVLLQQAFKIENNVILFDVILHLGTLIAVIIVYRKSLLDLIKHPFSQKAKFLVTATIPTLLIAIIFKEFFENAFNGSLLIFGFLTTAIFMFICSYVSKHYYQYKQFNYKTSFLVGIFQGLAILPGISRSGSTITSAIVCGIKRKDAAEFSFLLSIPIILCSALYECTKLGSQPIQISAISLVLGFVSAFLTGIISIKFMLSVIKNAKYSYFAYYLIILSIFLILNKYVLFLF